MRILITSLALIFLGALRLTAVETSTPIGIVYANQDAFFDLVYHNDSTAPVSIQQIKVGCDCITILTHPATVAAGTSAKILCVYRSATPGTIQTVVEIVFADLGRAQANFRITGFVAEKSWLTDAKTVLSGKSGEAFLVDVRRPDDFQRVHPAQAVNLPVFSLKARLALKSRRLVLVDEGFAPESLLAEVLTLREQGFRDVAVLQGGLPAWVRAGGKVVGEGKSAQQLSTVEAPQFGRSSASNPWICIEVGGASQPAPSSLPVARVANVTELEKKLSINSWPVSGGAPFQPVLLIADAQTRAQVENRLAPQRGQIFYLNGNTETLAGHAAAQLALGRHTEQTMTSRPSTARASSRSVATGSCGSCGSK